MSYKVFISSSQKDLDLARDLAKRIEDAGVTVSSSEERSQTTDMQRWQVGKQLRTADEVVIILSHESLNNPSLMFELGAASSLRKRVTPVVVGVEQNKVPSLIKSLKYITYPQLQQFISELEKRAKAA